MGYVPPPARPPRLNVDRRGLPRDFATYVWLMYRRHVVDDSPARRAFLYGPSDGIRLPAPNPMLLSHDTR